MPEPKINARNLTYDGTLPPFLARLHGQHASSQREGGADPMLAARRRPGVKKRSASEEAEDAPVVVDEHGNVVSLAGVSAADADGGEASDVEGEDGAGRKGGSGEGEGAEEGGKDKGSKDSQGSAAGELGKREKVAGIGGVVKKRKVGRVVTGDDEDDGHKEEEGRTPLRTKPTKQAKGESTAGGSNGNTGKTAPTTATGPSASASTKPKKKAKKIKLSFGDDEEAG
ncbi:uncharacterized protein B0I36DRAFT_344851 [Microdochium trichocladiopsis]|uniref:DUF4604 domain-containing protein n=1 Tax=Microdochium trichocladiopsis TaxID=1682393 RepID=A0A9P9BWX5_9PEZI|nr:uncharacterized protein B0I36DRAFT_344851 [Microdochium trichocladiopsis]KAH7041232.1 hypothetical protein B0I36DRAFT_344851 [Microdochium trichocladiopsis]